jgi:predicted pyridoxine 5'-phosphate oxidase superfamily flavin-nucleotide-binding protein
MSEIYGEQHRALQQAFDTTRLADRVEQIIVHPEIPDDHKAFIESRDMFFLSSVDHRGYPTCSYKGGVPGFVRVVDAKTIAFPSYDGNGMFLSMGNIGGNDKVGMLFIDFETPHRVRVHGIASLDQNDPLITEFPGAELLVRVAVTETFVNCPRYIHKYPAVADLEVCSGGRRRSLAKTSLEMHRCHPGCATPA